MNDRALGLDTPLKVPAAVLPLSVLLGLGLLIGRVAGIRLDLFQYITLEDVLISGAYASPLLLGGAAFRSFWKLAHTGEALESGSPKRTFMESKHLLYGGLLVLVLAFLTETASAFAGTLFLFGSFIVLQLLSMALTKARELTDNHGLATMAYALVVALFMIALLFGFKDTSSKLFSEEYVTDFCSPDCAPTNLVLRLSDVTVIRRRGEQEVTIIPNSEVKSVRTAPSRMKDPIFDKEAIGGWIWRRIKQPFDQRPNT